MKIKSCSPNAPSLKVDSESSNMYVTIRKGLDQIKICEKSYLPWQMKHKKLKVIRYKLQFQSQFISNFQADWPKWRRIELLVWRCRQNYLKSTWHGWAMSKTVENESNFEGLKKFQKNFKCKYFKHFSRESDSCGSNGIYFLIVKDHHKDSISSCGTNLVEYYDCIVVLATVTVIKIMN